MRLFVSTFVNKVDGKGRVSVPASFRTVLGGGPTQTVMLFQSFTEEGAIEGWPEARLEQMADSLDDLDQLAEERADLVMNAFASVHAVTIDKDGRMILPPDLAETAGISDQAAFVGQGRTFQIWDPTALDARKATARARAKSSKVGLRMPRGGTS